MPPRGVKSSKRARQYEHIKESAKKQGRSTSRKSTGGRKRTTRSSTAKKR